MKKLIVCVIKNPKDYDHDDVRWKDFDTGEFTGFGYQGKKEGDPVCLIRCPECGRENYMAAVPTGACAWCPFKTHESAKDSI
jgi:hypothetical protein